MRWNPIFRCAGFGTLPPPQTRWNWGVLLPTTIVWEGLAKRRGIFWLKKVLHIVNNVFKSYRGDTAQKSKQVKRTRPLKPASAMLFRNTFNFREPSRSSFSWGPKESRAKPFLMLILGMCRPVFVGLFYHDVFTIFYLAHVLPSHTQAVTFSYFKRTDCCFLVFRFHFFIQSVYHNALALCDHHWRSPHRRNV